MSSTLSPDVPRARFLELTSEGWFSLATVAALIVTSLAAARPDVTLIVALGLAFTIIVVGHLCMTARRFVAFPDLVVLAACLQWIVAPWLAEQYPPTLPVFRMSVMPDVYLWYAVPATIALWIGLHLPASRLLSKTWEMPATEPLSKYIRHSLDLAIVVGLLVDRFENSIPPQWLFLAYLIASFRFVGALGWMVTRTPGWQLRVIVVLVHLAAVQSTGGLFYLVVHWGGYFLLVYAFMRRWRWTLAGALVAGMFGLALLQMVKPTFRTSLIEQQVTGPIEAFTRLGSMMFERLREGRLVEEDTDVGDTLVRFNQGWIIARIMTHVPAEQPYAMGSTLADAAVFSVIPRFLVPSKREGSSRQLFSRYTGVNLMLSTRMGLGIIGEMYANFGKVGGVFATFLYGLLMGWLFLLFARRAQRNPMWWAVASVVLLPGVEPGFNLEDIANHVVKAGILFLVVWKFVPAMRELLALPPAPDEADEGDESEAHPPFEGAVADHSLRS